MHFSGFAGKAGFELYCDELESETDHARRDQVFDILSYEINCRVEMTDELEIISKKLSSLSRNISIHRFNLVRLENCRLDAGEVRTQLAYLTSTKAMFEMLETFILSRLSRKAYQERAEV
jgi:hypothetical protein